MTITAVDTSVLIAATLAWHEAHRPSLEALVAIRGAAAGRLVVPQPALVEAYAVMTRLPAPHRLAPADAMSLLGGSFEGYAAVVTLTERETWSFLRDAAAQGIAGGLAYDGLILQCAVKAGATRLLTLDRRDFTRLRAGSVEIVVPGN